jgi:hypothetical protein
LSKKVWLLNTSKKFCKHWNLFPHDGKNVDLPLLGTKLQRDLDTVTSLFLFLSGATGRKLATSGILFESLVKPYQKWVVFVQILPGSDCIKGMRLVSEDIDSSTGFAKVIWNLAHSAVW